MVMHITQVFRENEFLERDRPLGNRVSNQEPGIFPARATPNLKFIW